MPTTAEQDAFAFAAERRGELVPSSRKLQRANPVAVSAPLVRSSAPRAVSGINASVLDVIRGRVASIQALVPWTYLTYLRQLAVIHPLISQAVKLLETNANRGHSIVADAPDGADALVDQFARVIEDFNGRIYPRGGMDGLINACVAEIGISGALSVERVVRPGQRVERVVLVPAEDVEFLVPEDADDGDFRPYQRNTRGGMTQRLDERTYDYLAWRTMGNNPYAMPPFVAAIDAVLRESDMLDQMDAILRKVGWLGLLSMSVPERPGIDDQFGDVDEKTRERQAYLSQLATNIGANFRESIILLDEGMKFDYHAAPNAVATGSAELYRMNEEQIFSGIGMDPALFGRNWAKSETWFGQVRSIMEAMAESAQRLVGTSLGRTVALECQLHGLPLKPWVQFTPSPAMRPELKATADAATWAMKKEQAQTGLLTPDAAAQELGYDEWADPSRLDAAQSSPFGGGGFGFRARFRYDRASGRYVFARPRLSAPSLAPKPKARATTKARRLRRAYAKGPGARILARMVERFIARYAGKIAPVLDEVRDQLMERLRKAVADAPANTWGSPDEFGTWAADQLQQEFPKVYDARADQVLSRVLETHEENAKEWMSERRRQWLEEKASEQALTDVQVEDISALAQGDEYHMSIYLKDMSSGERATIQAFIAQEIEAGGKDITDPDVLDGVLSRLERSGNLLLRRRDHGREGGELSETDAEALDRMGTRVRRIVDTSVMRSLNTNDLRILEDAEFDEFEIVAGGDPPAGEICAEMNGRRISVSTSAAAMAEFLAMTPSEQEQALTARRELTPDELEKHAGFALPPFHPFCRCGVSPVE